MPKLAKIALFNLGHKDGHYPVDGERFDLTIDGLPVETLLFGPNGTGKTTLIAHYFSLLHPNVNDFIGRKHDKREFDAHVPLNERAAIVTEWVSDSTSGLFGDDGRFLVGGVYEKPGKLNRFWFSYRVDPKHPETSLDAFALTEHLGGNRYRMRAFDELRQQVHELRAKHPHIDAQTFTSQNVWEEHLEKRFGIDQTLIRYQIAMNLKESSAEEGVKIRNLREFVAIFQRAALTFAKRKNAHDLFMSYRASARALKTRFEPEMELCAALAAPFNSIKAVKDERTSLNGTMRGLKSELHAGIATSTSELQRLANEAAATQQRTTQVRSERAEAEKQANALKQDVAWVTWRAAQLDTKAVAASAAKLQAKVKALVAEGDAIAPAQTLLEIRAFEQEIRNLNDLIEAKRAGAHDEAARAERAASHLLHLLDADLASAKAAVEHVEKSLRETQREMEAHAGQAEGYSSALKETEEQLDRVKQHLTSHATLRKQFESEGILGAQESVAHALARYDAAEKEARSQKHRCDKARFEQGELHVKAEAQRQEAAKQLALIADSKERAARELEAALDERRRIQNHPHLQAAIQNPEWDPDELNSHAERLLSQSVEAATTRWHQATARLATLEAERAYLNQHSLLPPTPDALAVLAALRTPKSGVSAAWSTAEYLNASIFRAGMPAEEVLAKVRVRPLLATGVIVPEGELEAARHAIEGEKLKLATPVLLATPSALTEDERAPGVIVGPSQAARYHTEHGAHALADLTARLETAQDAAHAAEQHHRDLARARQEYEQYQATTAKRIPELGNQITALEAAEEAEQGKLTEAEERAGIAAHHVEQQATASHNYLQAAELAATSAKRLKLNRFPSIDEGAKRESEAKQRLEAERDDLLDRRAKSQTALEAARERKGSLEQERVRARAAQADLTEAREALLLTYPDLTPVAPPTGVTREAAQVAYDLARAELERRTDASELIDRRTARESDLKSRKQNLRATRNVPLALIENLASQHPNREALQAHADALRAKRDAAQSASNDLQVRLGAAQSTQSAAARAAQGAGISDPERHALATPSATPQWELTRANCENLRALWDQAARAAHSQVMDLQEQQAALEQEAAAIDSRSSELGELIEDLQEVAANDILDDVTVAPWHFKPEDLTSATVRGLRATAKQLAKEWAELERRLNAATRLVHNTVKAQRYQDLNLGYVDRIANSDAATFERNVTQFQHDLEQLYSVAESAIKNDQEHRGATVKELQRLSEDARLVLVSTQAAGRLKKGNGLSNLIALRAPRPNEDDAARALHALLEELLANDDKLTPDTLLERCFWAYMGGDNKVDVKIRHPSMGNDDLIPIDELAQKSGGENLTLIILLFCVLMRVRSDAKSQNDGAAGGFPLILDNPFGSANRADLVKLQVDYADSLGIQLIYSTGIKDENSIAMLRKHIRMRKAVRDLRTGRLLVGVDRSERSRLLSMAFFRNLATAAPSLDADAPTS